MMSSTFYLLLVTLLTTVLHVFDNANCSPINGQDSNVNNGNEYCYSYTKNPYVYFSSKTSYDAVYYRNNIDNIIPSECKPRQLWMLIRHGSRFPNGKKMLAFQGLSDLRNHIILNHQKHRRGDLCHEDIENLKEWSTEHIPLSESDHLTHQGYNDLKDIGERTRNKFNVLFKSPYSAKKYMIQYTNHEKTKLSAEAFSNGLFGRNVDIPLPSPEDLLFGINPDCIKVKALPEVNGTNEGKSERTLFKNSPIVKELVYNVSKRLGFIHNLSLEAIDSMYDMCRYKKSWVFEELSPWCACFVEQDLQILEYLGDLSYYYNSGHGYTSPLRNLKTGCPLVRDLLDRFRDIVTNTFNDQPKAIFYFGHSTTLYNLFAGLELAKDEVPITHDNYNNMTKRMWRTSLIGPFGANFGVVLLNCDSGIKNRVVFYHNETPLKFKQCHGYVCSWESVDNMYRNITDPSTCNYNFCESNEYKNAVTTKINLTKTIVDKSYNVNNYINQNFSEELNVTNDKINSIPKVKLSRNEYVKNYTVIHRKVQSMEPEINNHVTTSLRFKKNLSTMIRSSENDIESLPAFKPKKIFSDRYLNLSWLLISILVCVVVLILCHRYTTYTKQSKAGKFCYEKMSFVQLREFND